MACQDKKQYPTKRAAKKALREAKSRRGWYQDIGRPHENLVYACGHCGGWHLTSQHPRKAA